MSKKTMTFRTEGFGDGEHVPCLMELCNFPILSQKEITDAGNDNWKMDQFSIEVPADLSVKDVQVVMGKAMEHESLTERELHRCIQTLAEGLETNEFWWKS